MRDHIFSRASSLYTVSLASQSVPPTRKDILLLFPDTLTYSPEAVGHDASHCCEIVHWSKAADGKVSAVLDWLVAARGRHVLRHDGTFRSCDKL